MSSNGAAPKNIYVFGSANQDLVLSVAALPTSGETVLAGDVTRGYGGKGANQAIAGARAGGRVAFVGAVGDDEWATRIVENLEAHDVDTTFVERRAGEKTGLAVVVVDEEGSNQIVVAPGAGASLAVDGVELAIGAVRQGDVVVVQCEIAASRVEQIVRGASRAGASVVLNLAPFANLAVDALSSATIIIVNESEGRALVDALVPDDRLAQSVADTVGTACIVTLGSKGSMYASPFGTAVAVPAHRVKNVVDTTGAGDVYVGTFAARLAEGEGIRDSMTSASAAAAQSVLTRGAQARQPESVDNRVG